MIDITCPSKCFSFGKAIQFSLTLARAPVSRVEIRADITYSDTFGQIINLKINHAYKCFMIPCHSTRESVQNVAMFDFCC